MKLPFCNKVVLFAKPSSANFVGAEAARGNSKE